MADESQEKTEQKSRKKWEEARDRGELPRSQDIATLVIFLILILYFYFVGIGWLDHFGKIMADMLRFDRFLDLNSQSLKTFFYRPFLQATRFLAPFFLIVLVFSFVVNMSQTGFHIARDKVKIDPARLDPVKGMKKIFSVRSWVEGLKSLVKILLFVAIAYYTLRAAFPDLAQLSGHTLRFQLQFMLALILKLGLRVTMLMVVLAALDYGWQWWQFQEKLKMTPRELKDEMKEQEGDPLIRQRMRSLRMEMARRRMMSEVTKAQVVVTNPTHYAVALRYEHGEHAAPWVCAKGSEHLALKIREIALEHGIPVIEHPPIARALFRKVKIGQSVPSDFYRVVAELLAYVYLLKLKGRGAGSRFRFPITPRLRTPLPEAARRELQNNV